jgi:hypothetical protein
LNRKIGGGIKEMKMKITLIGIVIAITLVLAPIIMTGGCTTTQPTEPKPSGVEAGVIKGTVIDVDGKPVAGMRVSIVSGTVGFPEILALTDERGRYSIGSVPAGTFEVAVHDEEGSRVGLESIVVRDGETSTLDFTITAQAVVEEEDLPPATAEPEKEEVKWAADGVLGDMEYLGEMSYGNYEIRWLADDQYIYIGIKAKTTGWVAIGFEPSSGMKDADMVFGFVQSGKTIISDQFSTGTYGPHSPDTELGGTDDILESGGKEEGGFTIIEFKRTLDTGDRYDKALAEGAIKIIWAYGPDDEITKKHAVRGDGEISI